MVHMIIASHVHLSRPDLWPFSTLKSTIWTHKHVFIIHNLMSPREVPNEIMQRCRAITRLSDAIATVKFSIF